MSDTIRYLVAWGGDKRSQDALALGIVLARTFRAGLDVVYVLHTEEYPTVQHVGEANFPEMAAEQMQERLDAVAAEIPDEIDARVHLRRASSIAVGIVDAAQEFGDDVIVIGAGSGMGVPLASPIVGSLLHASSVPVAMAPRGYRRTSFSTLSELACAVGTRAGAHHVVEEAVAGVTRVGLPLRLVSLVDLTGRDRDAGKQAKDEAQRALDDAEKAVAGRCEVRTELAKGKDLRQAVKKIDWPADSALVIGSSRLASANKTFLGTTAARMLAHLPIPMIVVPSRGSEPAGE